MRKSQSDCNSIIEYLQVGFQKDTVARALQASAKWYSMTDIYDILPRFNLNAHSEILATVENVGLSVSDLLVLGPQDVAFKLGSSVHALSLLTEALLSALHRSLALGADVSEPRNPDLTKGQTHLLQRDGHDITRGWQLIGGLDSGICKVLNGGIPRGYLTEVCGESGTGKTQLLLMLLLSVQLPSPHGFESSALYISTEAQLPTNRLNEILEMNELLCTFSAGSKPSLSRVFSISTPDLESLDHIVSFQLPVAILRNNVGLVVIDSIAANYRVEYGKRNGSNDKAAMAERALHLQRLAFRLRNLARTYNTAIVVSNQVSDNIREHPQSKLIAPIAAYQRTNMSSNLFKPTFLSRCENAATPTQCSPRGILPMTLDQQQKWLLDWRGEAMQSTTFRFFLPKQPALGFVWSNQIAARIILSKEYSVKDDDQSIDRHQYRISQASRLMRVMYSSWASRMTENSLGYFEIATGGFKLV